MSTSGHYTRYINHYPGWSDNCDSMHRSIYEDDLTIGGLTVEHNCGNKWAYCLFSNWSSISAKYGYQIHETLFEHTGKLSIQAILERVEKEDIPGMISDVVFKAINFYQYAYLDYIERISNPEKYHPDHDLQKLNEWLDCDTRHCLNPECSFTCRYMTANYWDGWKHVGNPSCRYFSAVIGTLGIIA